MSPRNLKKRRSSTLCTPICMPQPESCQSRPCLESLDIPDHLIQQSGGPKFCSAKISPSKSSQGTCSCEKQDGCKVCTKNKVDKHKHRKHDHLCRQSNVKIKEEDSRLEIRPVCCAAERSKDVDASPTMSLTSCMSISTSIDYQPSKSSHSQTAECCAVDLQSGQHVIKIQLMPPNTVSSTHLRSSCTPSVSKESQTNMKKTSSLSWGRSDQFFSPSEVKRHSSVQVSDAKPTCCKHNQTESSVPVGCCAEANGGYSPAEEDRTQRTISDQAGMRFKIEMNQVHRIKPEPVAPTSSNPRQCCHNKCHLSADSRKPLGTEPRMSCEFAAPKDCECSLPPAYNEYGCTGNISGNCNCNGD